MKKEFVVELMRTEYATLYVEAEDWEEAETLAMKRLSRETVKPNIEGSWEITDTEEA